MTLHSNIIGEGKPFLILHGFLGSGDNWKTFGRALADKGIEVHLVDARNHGRSFHHDNFNYELMAADLKSYAAQHSIDNFILLGHSMGGKTSMLFSTLFPEMVEKLIVADIAPRYYPIHHDQILAGLNKLDQIKLTSRSEADEILASYIPEFGVRQFLLKNLYWNEDKQLKLRLNLQVLTEKVEEVGESLPPEAVFPNPTLFLKGEYSEYISQTDEADIKRHFPDSKIVEIPEAGHWLHAEKPEEFFEQVLKFVSN